MYLAAKLLLVTASFVAHWAITAHHFDTCQATLLHKYLLGDSGFCLLQARACACLEVLIVQQAYGVLTLLRHATPQVCGCATRAALTGAPRTAISAHD